MKASELIEKLAKIITVHGDRNILMWEDQHMTYKTIKSIQHIDKNSYDKELWDVEGYRENFKKIANNIVLDF